MVCHYTMNYKKAVLSARKLRDAPAVLFGLKFADNIHYKFKSSQASKTMLQSSKHTVAEQGVEGVPLGLDCRCCGSEERSS